MVSPLSRSTTLPAMRRSTSSTAQRTLYHELAQGLHVGVFDAVDQKHARVLEIPGSSKQERGLIDHTPTAVEVWVTALRQRLGRQLVAVPLDQSRGARVFMLTKYKHLVIFPLHPTVLPNYCKSFRPSGAKDDPGAAGLLLEILTLQPGQVPPVESRRSTNTNMAVIRTIASLRARSRGVPYFRSPRFPVAFTAFFRTSRDASP